MCSNMIVCILVLEYLLSVLHSPFNALIQKAISFLELLGKVLFWITHLKDCISLPQPREVQVQILFLSQAQIKIKFTQEKVNVSILSQEKVKVSISYQEKVKVS